eukprot:8472759-Prorocentrum_lima.AAC.1
MLGPIGRGVPGLNELETATSGIQHLNGMTSLGQVPMARAMSPLPVSTHRLLVDQNLMAPHGRMHHPK